MKWPVPARPREMADGLRRLQPERLNVTPALMGAPLGTPWRRTLAMGVDLAVIGLLTGVSGLWLWAGLVLVVLQLRQRQRKAPARRREVVGWALAALLLVLAFGEASTQWYDWRHPEAAAAAAEAGPEPDDAEAPASAPTAAASATSAGDAAASAPAVSDAERIARLEAELAEARRPKKLKLGEQVSGFLDEIGAGLGWGIVYFSLLPAWWGGQTVGKKLLRLRVVELTGQPMTVMRNLKRYGGYAAGLATGGLGFLQILWEPNRQGLQDKAAHTAVLDLRHLPGDDAGPAPAAPPAEPAA